MVSCLCTAAVGSKNACTRPPKLLLVCAPENCGRHFNTDCMFEMKIARRFRAFFVRVGYTARYTAARERAPLVGLHAQIRCKTYVPRRVHCGFENAADVMERVRKDLAVRGMMCAYIVLILLVWCFPSVA